ncbi:MAG: HAD-IA family hydrolase, partial [Anaerolineae bacterium]|nr:HAD-IA family hydrolase [Anaerolineae bacterium]
MRFRYLIWDVDGTLFDTYPTLVASLRQALVEFGIEAETAYIAALMQRTFDYALDTLLGAQPIDRDALIARYLHLVRAIPTQEQPLFPGVRDVCQRLNAAGGANFIFTHRRRQTLQHLLDVHGAADLFRDVLTVDDGYPRKPDPGGFLTLVARHELPHAETLAIGDRDLDVLAGAAAGISTCLFAAQPVESQ